MNEIMKTTSLTPIEVELGIDEQGRTTARKLYSFLELNPAAYARWCKTNILENEFADEGMDYEVFNPDVENPQGGRPTQDFRLSASFAKKLAMMAKNERGEQARQYFVAVEDGLKKVASEKAVYANISPELKAIIFQDQKIQAVESRVDEVDKDLQQFKLDMPLLGLECEKITTAVRQKGVSCLGGKESVAYADPSLRGRVYSDIYGELKRQFGVASYKAIKRSQTDIALEVIGSYELPIVLEEEIELVNEQIAM